MDPQFASSQRYKAGEHGAKQDRQSSDDDLNGSPMTHECPTEGTDDRAGRDEDNGETDDEEDRAHHGAGAMPSLDDVGRAQTRHIAEVARDEGQDTR